MLREIEDYIPDSHDDDNSINRLVEGEPDAEVASMFSAPSNALVRGMISGYNI